MAAAVSPLILGIETSCDDTACAVVDGAGRVLSSVVSSQLAAHRPYGGVVPEIASREHLANWPLVAEQALSQAGVALPEIDAVAATRGPGLVGALLVGLSLGKALALGLSKPFYAVHHLEGHLVSPFLAAPEPGAGAASAAAGPAEPPPESFVGLVASGGHTALYEVEGATVRTLAETRDDAFGEVFDKVGKRLGLPYPQGPRVDELAERGSATGAEFRVPKNSDQSLDFSYSGLKSETLSRIEGLERQGVATDLGAAGSDAPRLDAAGAGEPPQPVLDLLAAFRAAAVKQVMSRLNRLRRRRRIGFLAVSGGAAANRLLRRELRAWAAEHEVPLRLVPLAYAGDNAAMIAHAALLRARRGEAGDPLSTDAASRIAV